MDSRLHSKGNLGLKATARFLLGMLGCGVGDLTLILALPMPSSVTLGKSLLFHIYKLKMLDVLQPIVLVPSNILGFVCLFVNL